MFSQAVLAGWGRNYTGGPVQEILQKVDLKVFNTFDCANVHYNEVFHTNICAGGPDGKFQQMI